MGTETEEVANCWLYFIFLLAVDITSPKMKDMNLLCLQVSANVSLYKCVRARARVVKYRTEDLVEFILNKKIPVCTWYGFSYVQVFLKGQRDLTSSKICFNTLLYFQL
jgi:hypothetical protein